MGKKEKEEAVARPFVKWVGGKTQLLDEILEFVPEKVGTYYEPFLGGGAVFFALAKRKTFEKAVISDLNLQLCLTYEVIAQDVEMLITRLKRRKAEYMEAPDRRAYYLQERASPSMTPLGIATRFIFLNKTGFNGLFRVNAKGEFNVPWGQHEDPPICDEENLRLCSTALAGATILNRPFADLRGTPVAGDLVYFDPPYVPVNPTSNFTKYTKEGFELHQQEELAKLFAELAGAGVRVIASNADVPLVRELYQGFDIHAVQARRSINSKGGKRGPVGEVLIVGGPG